MRCRRDAARGHCWTKDRASTPRFGPQTCTRVSHDLPGPELATGCDPEPGSGPFCLGPDNRPCFSQLVWAGLKPGEAFINPPRPGAVSTLSLGLWNQE